MHKITIFSSYNEFAYIICEALAAKEAQVQLLVPDAAFSAIKKRLDRFALVRIRVFTAFEDVSLVKAISDFFPDLLVSAIFDIKIPAFIRQIAKEAVNIHPAPLPKYRGPNIWGIPIRQRDSESGICIHRLTDAFDRGEICHFQPVSLAKRENLLSLAAKLISALGLAWEDFFEKYISGRLTFEPNEGGSYFKKLTLQDTWIRFDQGALEIDALVRSLSDKTPANCFLESNSMSLLEAVPTNESSASDIPGLLVEHQGRLLLATIDEYLEIRSLAIHARGHARGVLSSDAFIEAYSQVSSPGCLLTPCEHLPELAPHAERVLDTFHGQC